MKRVTAWPSLTIIIPSFNQGNYIERTLLSILKQRYEGKVQIIVSDGGSDDGTLDVLRKYPEIKWWSSPDKGFADAVMKGLSEAKSDIVAIQSSDDYYLKDAFRLSIGSLIENESLALIAGCDVHLAEDWRTFTASRLSEKRITPKSLLFGKVVPQHTTFVHREAVENVNGLRPEVDMCADIDLWYRILHRDEGQFIPAYTAAYQLHRNQRTQVSGKWFKSFVTMVESCESDPTYVKEFRLTAVEKMNFFVRREIAQLLKQGEMDLAAKRVRAVQGKKEFTLQTKVHVKRLLGMRVPPHEKVILQLTDGNLLSDSRMWLKRQREMRRLDLDWWKI